jgi:hypothetical protein
MPTGQMEFAAFAVAADHPDARATIVPLSGDGGSLVANVNRWEGQLKLPPTPESDLAKLIKPLKVAGQDAPMFDLLGPAGTDGKPQQRILATLVRRPTTTWFFKVIGPAETIAAQQANFLAFVDSVQFGASDLSAPAGPSTTPSSSPPIAGADGSTLIKYSAPAAWVKQPIQKEFRIVTFQIPSGATPGEVIVTRFPGLPGSLLDNINRWRGQVGLEPAADLSSVSPTTITIAGTESKLYSFEGAATGDKPATAIIVAVANHGPEYWFFKLQGPAKVVADQKQAFNDFLSSIQFTGQ